MAVSFPTLIKPPKRHKRHWVLASRWPPILFAEPEWHVNTGTVSVHDHGLRMSEESAANATSCLGRPCQHSAPIGPRSSHTHTSPECWRCLREHCKAAPNTVNGAKCPARKTTSVKQPANMTIDAMPDKIFPSEEVNDATLPWRARWGKGQAETRVVETENRVQIALQVLSSSHQVTTFLHPTCTECLAAFRNSTTAERYNMPDSSVV